VVEQLRLATNIELTHVPYRGSAPMLTEMVAERIEVGMDNIPSALTFIRDGKIRAIATTGARSRCGSMFRSRPTGPILPKVRWCGFRRG